LGLSEKSNDAYLLKKIEVNKRRLIKIDKLFKPGLVLSFGVGTVVTLLSVFFGIFFLDIFTSETAVTISRGDIGYWVALVIGLLFLIAVFGSFLLAIHFIGSIHYYTQLKGYYKKLTVIPEELRACSVCPNCSKVLPKDFPDVCIFCGYNPYRPNRKINGYDKKLILFPVCPNCKKPLPERNAQFCIYCGKSLKS
jgi:hypothetical protein